MLTRESLARSNYIIFLGESLACLYLTRLKIIKLLRSNFNLRAKRDQASRLLAVRVYTRTDSQD